MAYSTPWNPDDRGKCIVEACLKAYRAHAGIDSDKGVLYRFDDVAYASRIDPYDDSDYNWYSQRVLELEAFAVKKWTPKGATLHIMSGARNKFVNFEHTKQFACKTVDEALASYIARREKQARIYAAKADLARKCVLVAKGLDHF